MKRRDFIQKAGLLSAIPIVGASFTAIENKTSSVRKAKNIIFMVADGMSTGTLTIAHLFQQNVYHKNSTWIDLYLQNKVTRGIMETSSANSMVTDSAAASSAWGGGIKVKNNSLNVGPNGERPTPIWPQFQKAGKSVGCITTVPITHATPAGFLVNNPTRKDQEKIADLYLEQGFDLLLGGGKQYFDPMKRSDKKDLIAQYQKNGYSIITEKDALAANTNKKILGLFADDALPYAIDRKHQKHHQNCPSLTEMSKFALEKLSKNPNGFVLQIEAGKVDWAAHGNDLPGLIFDQIEFDHCIEKVVEFAEKDGETLVIITTDHGNSNPGLLYGKKSDEKFLALKDYKSSNAEVLVSISKDTSVEQIIALFKAQQNWDCPQELANDLLNSYTDLTEEDLSNYRNLPFFELSAHQEKLHHVGWIGNEHSADFVELCAMGPGAELIQPFQQNTELHNLMLKAGGII